MQNGPPGSLRSSQVAFYGAFLVATVLLLYPIDLPDRLALSPNGEFLLPLDWCFHLALFGVLYWLRARVEVGGRRGRLDGREWQILLGLVLYGALIELVQNLVPERGGSWPDLAADAIGCSFAAIIWRRYARIRRTERG